jgi:hypothetical protein
MGAQNNSLCCERKRAYDPHPTARVEVLFMRGGEVMRKLLLLICALGISCVSLAQGSSDSWKSLNMLRVGDKVQVVKLNSKKISGTFLSLTHTGISLQSKTGQQTIEMEDVRTVKLMVAQHRWRNTLIGGGIGAGAGAGVGAATSCSSGECTFGRGVGIAIGAVAGLVPGALAGAFVPTHNTIYP